MIDQISVFLENKQGRLSELTSILANAGINMHSLTIADSASYGMVRIICDTPEAARTALEAADFTVRLTKVLAIQIDGKAGSLAALMDAFDNTGINIEYGYCFSSGPDAAIDVFKVHEPVKAAANLADAGFKVLEPKDIYHVD